MAEPIPHIVQSGENMMDIAKKLGLKDWHQLKEYHDSVSDQKTSETPFVGSTLMTPSQEEVYEMNGEEPPLDPVEEEKEAEKKQEEEKKKEEEEKKQEELSKGEHDGKYFVVHGAKCVCDKAVNPMQTADLQVTSHKSIVLNDQSTKYLATEDDKTFLPPAATFGQCKLQPTTGGYLPCSLSPAPKWTKTYESTQVLGKKTLTEISELQCMIGGKITIFKHGQTDSVSNAHADNTDPLELAAVNPAIEQPKKKVEYPVVTSIAITEIENRENFKVKDSKSKEVIFLRKDEEASFRANLKSGNKQLTSWMVYTDHKGSKENRLLLREQIGIEFSQSFGEIGKYRVEGYGKPKTPEFEKGKYDKCDATCSIDIEVVENKLQDLGITSAEYSSRIDLSKKLKFRKGVPTRIRAEFFIQRLTEDEKARLTMHVEDGGGNTISDAIKGVTSITFTPKNSNATYTVKAQYTTESGEVIEKQLSGESEGNVVLGIKRIAEIVNPEHEVVRPGTSMTFQISKMRYGFLPEDPDYNITTEESAEIKWNLDGVLIGTGSSITIPGNKLMATKKYVLEAFSKTANATGKGAKNEEDDWHFEVKNNDVISFSLSGNPKVGKPITATVDKMVFADLLPNEIIHWTAPLLKGTGKSVKMTPKIAGKFKVTCKINSETGVSKDIDVLVARITNGFWHDLQGNAISRASWGQKVMYSLGGENLQNEKIQANIVDKDMVSGNDDATDKNFTFGNAAYSNFVLQLDKNIKDNTTSSVTPNATLFVKAQITDIEKVKKEIPAKKGSQKYLEVKSSEEVYRGLIGDSDGKHRHNPVDYDMKSFVYANTTYAKDTKLTVKIFEDRNWEFDPEAKELIKTGTVAEDGVLRTEIDWGKLKDAKQNKKSKIYYVRIYDADESKVFDGSNKSDLCNTTLFPQSPLQKQAGYSGAVIVGGEDVPQVIDYNGVCECEARVRAFLRLIMVKESEQMAIKNGYSPYEINVGGKSFIQDHKKDYTTHPRVYISSANSTAAGAYQFLGWKYDEMNGFEINEKTYKKTGKYTEEKDYIKKYKINDFSPISQDRLCIANIKHYRSGIMKALISNDINKALDVASYEWASLPHNDPNYKTGTEWRYEGQHGQTLIEARANYEKFLKEELLGTTKYLEIKSGFLKEFGYNCCGEDQQNKIGNGKWRMPIDNPMLCMYSQGGGHKPWHGSFGEKIRDSSANHTGNDLLAIPGTDVYACLKSKVHKIYTSTSMAGNVIVLKVIDLETFKTLKNSSYLPKYEKKGEILQKGFDSDGIIYLTFWHLSKNNIFKEGDIVEYDDIIGQTGVSGWNGNHFTTRNPHLHFEVSNVGSAAGLNGKCNPSVYFKFKTEDELSKTEIEFQNKLMEKEWN